MDPEQLFQRVYRYRNYWGKKGGITVSGGEPLRQIDFVTRLFQLARAKGVHTALDTAGSRSGRTRRISPVSTRSCSPPAWSSWT